MANQKRATGARGKSGGASTGTRGKATVKHASGSSGKTGATTRTGMSGRSGSPASGRGKSENRTANGRSGRRHMIENLEEGFVGELGDMLYAGREFAKVLPQLAQSAGSRSLRQALDSTLEMTEEQVGRIEDVFRQMGHRAEAEPCEGMDGILEECRELLQKTAPGAVRDALVIAATQKAVHYAMASYGTLCSWAEQLDEGDAVRTLEDSLRETKSIDRQLTRIAEQGANPQAEFGRTGSYDDRPGFQDRERGGFDRARQERGDSGGRSGRMQETRGESESERMRGTMESRFGQRRGGSPGRERFDDE